jgi:hypothetical protein
VDAAATAVQAAIPHLLGELFLFGQSTLPTAVKMLGLSPAGREVPTSVSLSARPPSLLAAGDDRLRKRPLIRPFVRRHKLVGLVVEKALISLNPALCR